VTDRKRGLAAEVLGFVIAEIVPAANTHDSTAGMPPEQFAGNLGETVQKALVGQDFKDFEDQVIAHGAHRGLDTAPPTELTAQPRRRHRVAVDTPLLRT
jgi:hypothetical protein